MPPPRQPEGRGQRQREETEKIAQLADPETISVAEILPSSSSSESSSKSESESESESEEEESPQPPKVLLISEQLDDDSDFVGPRAVCQNVQTLAPRVKHCRSADTDTRALCSFRDTLQNSTMFIVLYFVVIHFVSSLNNVPLTSHTHLHHFVFFVNE